MAVGAALTAVLVLPLGASAADLSSGAFQIKSTNSETPGISAIRGANGAVSSGDTPGETTPTTPPVEETPEPTLPPEPAFSTTRVVYNTSEISGCTVPVLPISDRQGEVSISLNGGAYTPVTQDYPSLTGIGLGTTQTVDIRGKFGTFGTFPAAGRTATSVSTLNSKCIVSVPRWADDNIITKMPSAFASTRFLGEVAPIPSGVTDISGMFFSSYYSAANFTGWDTSKVTNMAYTFTSSRLITDEQLAKLKTDSVTDMTYIFSATQTATGTGIANWRTGNVKNFSYSFNNSSVRTGFEGWNTSSAEIMSGMFVSNQMSSNDLTKWDVSNVRDFSLMFKNSFNGNISTWNTSKAQNFSGMFDGNRVFNGSLGANWNIDGATDVSKMFYNSEGFKQDISSWKLSRVPQKDLFSVNSGLRVNDVPTANHPKN